MANSGPSGTWLAMSPELWTELLRHGGPILGWSLWCATGRVVRSTETLWSFAPRQGVQIVTTYHPCGVLWHSHYDEYTLPGEQETKLGLEIDFDRFESIRCAAEADGWRP